MENRAEFNALMAESATLHAQCEVTLAKTELQFQRWQSVIAQAERNLKSASRTAQPEVPFSVQFPLGAAADPAPSTSGYAQRKSSRG